MYTDEDLNAAIQKGVFSQQSVDDFRQLMSSSRHESLVDEENFRLISGFNDIFVVIACALLLFSSVWVLNSVSPIISYGVFIGLSWGLSEIFVRQRNMALPAIFLLLAFVGGVFVFCQHLFVENTADIVGTACALLAAYAHWRRFRVPMTIAVATASGLLLGASVLLAILPDKLQVLMMICFVSGVLCFVFAMYWDAQDRQRISRKSDVAFWLHLLSAPLIIHPVFNGLGVLSGEDGVGNMMLIVILYLLMTLISITVDRRAFMVSSLLYVIYALQVLFGSFGSIETNIAFTGVVMGATLLLLSFYWQASRHFIVSRLPSRIQAYLPTI
ncbi:hypothetical protein [Marinomonas sp. THO17]|uniref:hypothetical protein n=1 Tax=Marinomonas sp. THO17 TaxID=3149048 RepID=UPI00336BCD17